MRMGTAMHFPSPGLVSFRTVVTQGERGHKPKIGGNCAYQHLKREDIGHPFLPSRPRSVPKVRGSITVELRRGSRYACSGGGGRTNISPVARGSLSASKQLKDRKKVSYLTGLGNSTVYLIFWYVFGRMKFIWLKKKCLDLDCLQISCRHSCKPHRHSPSRPSTN